MRFNGAEAAASAERQTEGQAGPRLLIVAIGRRDNRGSAVIHVRPAVIALPPFTTIAALAPIPIPLTAAPIPITMVPVGGQRRAGERSRQRSRHKSKAQRQPVP